MSHDDGESGHNEVRIIRGRVDSLSLYEITETELDALERGSPYVIHLNFGISLLTLGMSFLASLLTTDIRSMIQAVVFVVLTVVGILGGIFLLTLWYRARGEVAAVIEKIKTRIAEQTDESGTADEVDYDSC